MWKDLTKTCQKDSCLKEWELEKILEVRPCLFIQKLFQFYPDFIQILSRFFQTFSKAHFTHIFVLSVGYTETKYIKLKTKFQIFFVDISNLLCTFEKRWKKTFVPFLKNCFLDPLFQKCTNKKVVKVSFTSIKKHQYFDFRHYYFSISLIQWKKQ